MTQTPRTATMDDVRQFNQACDALRAEIGKVIVGQDRVVEELLIALFAGGHCLLVGVPGLAKTLLISTVAEALALKFSRIQFTPDLMPSDITGTEILEEDAATRKRSFRFIRGPIFGNVILADEINRTPPKTQAALLQAMQEKKVTAGGETYALDLPFFVLATQNPIEMEGTYPLPEAQLDRFLLRVSFGYPSPDEEFEVLSRRMARRREEVVLSPVVDATTLRAMQHALEDVVVEDSVGRYIVALTTATREHPQVLVGASPRGSLAMLLLSRAAAAMAGRDFVVPEDVKRVAIPALAHRITLRPEMWLRRVDATFVVGNVLEQTPAPASGAMPRHGSHVPRPTTGDLENLAYT
jgi:MoxR-like ATPase